MKCVSSLVPRRSDNYVTGFIPYIIAKCIVSSRRLFTKPSSPHSNLVCPLLVVAQPQQRVGDQRSEQSHCKRSKHPDPTQFLHRGVFLGLGTNSNLPFQATQPCNNTRRNFPNQTRFHISKEGSPPLAITSMKFTACAAHRAERRGS
jgi:hypothetical protein